MRKGAFLKFDLRRVPLFVSKAPVTLPGGKMKPTSFFFPQKVV